MELLKVTETMLVALNHAESAIKVAIADEDGLDGAVGEMTLKEIRQAVAQYHVWVYQQTHHPQFDMESAPKIGASGALALAEGREETEKRMNHTSRSVHDCKKGMEDAEARGRAAGLLLGVEEADNHNGCIDPECLKRDGQCGVTIANRLRAIAQP